MKNALRQEWWAPLAGLLALVLLAFAVAIGVSDGEDNTTEERVVGVILSLAGAFALAAGLWKRPQARRLGNALIVVGCVLAAFWFWTVVLPVVAIIVIVGLVLSEKRSPSRLSAN